MAEASLKVSDLLPAGLQIEPGELALRRDSAAAAALDDGVLAFAATKLRDAIGSALQLDVLELIGQAWSKADELRRACAEMRSPDDSRHVFLGKHDVVSENRLNVALEFAGVPTVTDHLVLVLTADFESVGVTLQAGHIVAVDAGRGRARVELKYSSAKLLGRSTEWVELPVRCRLSRPIEIARARTGDPKLVASRGEAAA